MRRRAVWLSVIGDGDFKSEDNMDRELGDSPERDDAVRTGAELTWGFFLDPAEDDAKAIGLPLRAEDAGVWGRAAIAGTRVLVGNWELGQGGTGTVSEVLAGSDSKFWIMDMSWWRPISINLFKSSIFAHKTSVFLTVLPWTGWDAGCSRVHYQQRHPSHTQNN